MLLQSNKAKRTNENAVPVKNDFRASFHKAAIRRRGLTNLKSPKYSVEQARRKKIAKAPAMFRICVPRQPPRAASKVADVLMKDASPPQPPTMVPLTLPVLLPRPDYVEVTKASIEAIDPELAMVDVEFVRDIILATNMGPSAYKGLQDYSVKDKNILGRGALPREVTLILNDMTSVLPSHMLAIHGPKSPSQIRPKATLFPAHSLIMTVECAMLQFPPSPVCNNPNATASNEVTLPVLPLFLDSPQTFPILLEFFYFKRKDLMLQRLLPDSFPSAILDTTEGHEHFAKSLGHKFRVPFLLEHMSIVFGVWQNLVKLGVFNEDIWEVVELAWKVLLMALSISSGRPEGLESIRSAFTFTMTETEQSETAEKSTAQGNQKRSTTPRDSSPCATSGSQ